MLYPDDVQNRILFYKLNSLNIVGLPMTIGIVNLSITTKLTFYKGIYALLNILHYFNHTPGKII